MTVLRTPPPEASELGLMVGTPPPPDRRVTVGNWRKAPFNRWSFQHVRELVPTALISRGEGPIWELLREPRDLTGITIDAGPAGTTTFGQLLEDTYTDAIAVLHNGKLIFEQYRNAMTPTTPHLVMSMSKSITSTATGILIGNGTLTPDQHLTDIVPELTGTSFDGATVRHLLDMRTGTGPLTAEQAQQDLEASYWAALTDVTRPMDITAIYPELVNERPHGTEFAYRSLLTCVLGLVAERAGGSRLADLVSQTLWQQLGAERDAEITLDGTGHALADVGVNATLRDLTRFGELMRTGGRRDQHQIVPTGWITDTLTPDHDTITAFTPHGLRYLPQPGAYYRNQWWVIAARTNTTGASYAALGIHGQMILIDEPSHTVITKLSTWPDPWDDYHAQTSIQGCLSLAREIGRGAAR